MPTTFVGAWETLDEILVYLHKKGRRRNGRCGIKDSRNTADKPQVHGVPIDGLLSSSPLSHGAWPTENESVKLRENEGSRVQGDLFLLYMNHGLFFVLCLKKKERKKERKRKEEEEIPKAWNASFDRLFSFSSSPFFLSIFSPFSFFGGRFRGDEMLRIHR